MSFVKEARPFDDSLVVNVGGFALHVPELTLWDREQLQTQIERVASSDVPVDERMDLCYLLVLTTLKRHYPDAEMDDLKKHFTAKNLIRAVRYALGAPLEDATAATDPTKSVLVNGPLPSSGITSTDS